MKKLISFFIIFTLLFVVPPAAIASDRTDAQGAAGQTKEEYSAETLAYSDSYDSYDYSAYSSLEAADDSGLVLWAVLGLCFFSSLTVISVYHRKAQ